MHDVQSGMVLTVKVRMSVRHKTKEDSSNQCKLKLNKNILIYFVALKCL